jgi:uncharacterized membrane protein YphA (DoxX/SURF4 family)
MTNQQKIGVTMLRLGLAFVFLWFGFSQLSNSAMWTSFVPDWATSIMDAGTLVLLNGVFEVVAGAMLAFGLLTRYVALLLGIHLFVIGGSMGFSAIGVRDIGLSIATLTLFFLGHEDYFFSKKVVSMSGDTQTYNPTLNSLK